MESTRKDVVSSIKEIAHALHTAAPGPELNALLEYMKQYKDTEKNIIERLKYLNDHGYVPSEHAMTVMCNVWTKTEGISDEKLRWCDYYIVSTAILLSIIRNLGWYKEFEHAIKQCEEHVRLAILQRIGETDVGKTIAKHITQSEISSLWEWGIPVVTKAVQITQGKSLCTTLRIEEERMRMMSCGDDWDIKELLALVGSVEEDIRTPTTFNSCKEAAHYIAQLTLYHTVEVRNSFISCYISATPDIQEFIRCHVNDDMFQPTNGDYFNVDSMDMTAVFNTVVEGSDVAELLGWGLVAPKQTADGLVKQACVNRGHSDLYSGLLDRLGLSKYILDAVMKNMSKDIAQLVAALVKPIKATRHEYCVIAIDESVPLLNPHLMMGYPDVVPSIGSVWLPDIIHHSCAECGGVPWMSQHVSSVVDWCKKYREEVDLDMLELMLPVLTHVIAYADNIDGDWEVNALFGVHKGTEYGLEELPNWVVSLIVNRQVNSVDNDGKEEAETGTMWFLQWLRTCGPWCDVSCIIDRYCEFMLDKFKQFARSSLIGSLVWVFETSTATEMAWILTKCLQRICQHSDLYGESQTTCSPCFRNHMVCQRVTDVNLLGRILAMHLIIDVVIEANDSQVSRAASSAMKVLAGKNTVLSTRGLSLACAMPESEAFILALEMASSVGDTCAECLEIDIGKLNSTQSDIVMNKIIH